MRMPPVKRKPLSPAPVLPRPRRPGMVALLLLLPMVIGAGLGACVGFVLNGVLFGTCVGAAFGLFVGTQTVFRLLHYAAGITPHATHRE